MAEDKLPDNGDQDTPRPGIAGRRRAAQIREFVLDALADGLFHEIGRSAAQRFGVRRHIIHKQLNRLEGEGLVQGRGRTKSRAYRLTPVVETKWFPVEGLDEDLVWREVVAPRINDLPPNVLGICQYGFTEMLNNAIDHSQSQLAMVRVERTIKRVALVVNDQGVGIFRKIQTALGLPTPQEALFELTKGKLTTDPERHTGEGIFFSSRAFDDFRLLSSGLFLSHEREGDDWLSGDEDQTDKGTWVRMSIAVDSNHTIQEVFEHYSSEREDYGFNKTNVVLRLLDTGDDSFVSRSQAKRVLARLARFKEVVLDFDGVTSIGPAFADEIFRVFAKAHPEVHLYFTRESESVGRMIARAQAAAKEASADSNT